MENSKAIGILQAVKAGTADIFISKAAINDALDMAIAALEQQEKAFDEWCIGCKEYDQEHHCCHRFTKVIRQTVEECKKERPDSKWYPVEEKLPEIHKDVLVTDREVSDVYVSYYCGGGYWGTDTGGANNRIIAWMPLPKPYQEDEA